MSTAETAARGGEVAPWLSDGSRPWLLDAFCCEGGCSVGYERAGFNVVGVDIEPQPRYPFHFVQGDAIRFIAEHGREFAAIHASPTCQTRARVTAWRGDRADHPDLLEPTLVMLRVMFADMPWVVENVTEAVMDGTMRADYLLCGSMFGLPVRRHRAFETSWPALQFTQSCQHRRTDLPFEHKGERAFADAMGCHWMTGRGGRQAIPPAYTELIGADMLNQLTEAAA